jgi:hypothetical protein
MNLDLLLPDSDLDPAHREFAQRMRAFAATALLPHARAVDEQRQFRRAMVTELGAAGILRGPIPPEHGGAGWTPLQLALAHEELGATCGNARGFCAVQTGLVAHTIARHGTAAQRERWLPGLLDGSQIGCFALTEPEAGSDVASLRTHARPVGTGFAATGEKWWITNGGVADVMILFATIDPAQGRAGITAFLVDTQRRGLQREPMPGIELGHRGSDHAVLRFHDFPLTADEMLGAPGKGFGVAMGGLAAGRLSVAAGAVGIHRAALEAALAFTTSRQQFGQSLASFQMVQERLADHCISLHASRALVHRVARRRAEGCENIADLAMAKAYSTEAAAQATEAALQLHGARGYSSAFPVERLWRDIQALRIYEGTTMIQKTILARALITPPKSNQATSPS